MFYIKAGTEFADRSEVSQSRLMQTWQSGMDGNRDAGCVAVFVSEKTSYTNEFHRSQDGMLEKVIMSGRGGRKKTKEGYTHVSNQEHHKNYPMFVSTVRGLPIHMVVEDAVGVITYHGLWKCTGHTYFPHPNSSGYNTYQFTLVPWRGPT